MKTVTEFSALALKAAAKSKQDLLAAGKTPEELPTALGEALKLEGEKLTLILSAIELAEKKPNDLKRIVVFKLGEGEKAPSNAAASGEHHLSAEYYPSLNPPRAAHGKDGPHGGRGGRDGKKKHGKGRGNRSGAPRDAASAGPGGRPSGNPAAGEGARDGAGRPPRRRPPRGDGQRVGAPTGTGSLPKPRPLPQPVAKAPSETAAAPTPAQESPAKE